jgi:hypothetical protein
MSTPFVENARLQGERLAAGILGFIGAQLAAGWADVVGSLVSLLGAPFVGLTGLLDQLASGIPTGAATAVGIAFEAAQSFIGLLGPFAFPAAIAFVLGLAGIVVYGRELV